MTAIQTIHELLWRYRPAELQTLVALDVQDCYNLTRKHIQEALNDDGKFDAIAVAKSFPLAKSPWRNVWLRFEQPDPKIENGVIHTAVLVMPCRSIQEVVTAYTLTSELASTDIGTFYGYNTFAEFESGDMVDQEYNQTLFDAGWTYYVILSFVKHRRRDDWQLFGGAYLSVNPEDEVHSMPVFMCAPTVILAEGIRPHVDSNGNLVAGPMGRKMASDIAMDVIVSCSVFSFANCRNVEVVRPKGHIHQRREKKEGIRIHQLRIEPIRKKIDGETRRTNARGNTALHIMRGHFKDYREKGLFGKYKGVYWWDQSMRGTNDDAKVIKGYRC